MAIAHLLACDGRILINVIACAKMRFAERTPNGWPAKV